MCILKNDKGSSNSKMQACYQGYIELGAPLRDLEFGSGKQRAGSGLIQILANKLDVFPAITAEIPFFSRLRRVFPLKTAFFAKFWIFTLLR